MRITACHGQAGSVTQKQSKVPLLLGDTQTVAVMVTDAAMAHSTFFPATSLSFQSYSFVG